MEFTNKAYLLIGGNIGDIRYYLQQATDLLQERCGNVISRSYLYETAAWGNLEQAAFLNQALELETTFSAGDLMDNLLLIEEKMGRKRRDKYGPRIIDIDILLFNDEVHATVHCTIPHKELQNRRFALQPLADIAPDRIHPIFHKTITQLLLECPDKLEVNRRE